jgi:FHS family glucose/mannose:H+ symporter-like MFS transporter
MLMSFPGAILPAWGYHLRDEFNVVGNYFLTMALGIVVSVKAATLRSNLRDAKISIVVGCALASAALIGLSFAPPPLAWWWRGAGISIVGLSAGILSAAAFRSISTIYQQDPASTVNLAGVLFGLGCLTTALFVSGTFYVYTVGSTLILLAVIPAFAAGLYGRSQFPPPVDHAEQSWREVWSDVKSPGAVMFTLLLFFQNGNEWSVAGWLAIYMVHRIGVNPSTSLLMLAVYWLALLVGRIAAQALLPRVSHGKLLIASCLAAILGSVILITTNNRFGAWSGILMLGTGFAMIYPLAVEKIGHRFPNYHPGFYNGIFSFGIVGGLLAPWTLGFAAEAWGIQAVMLLPLAGTMMVFLLVVLLWIENRLTATATGRP